jgi:crotonobetaine/carnitine-CoA ligase
MVDLIGNRNVPMLLAERVERYGSKPWLVFENADGQVSELSYAQFQEQVLRVAGGFAAAGVQRGDRVGIHLPNCPEFLLSFFALAHLGAIAVPSNVANTAAEMRHVIGHSQMRLLVTSPPYVEMFEGILPALPSIERVVVARGDAGEVHMAFGELLTSAPPAEPAEIHSELPVLMIFTSGTTALPKGVLLTHANCLWSGERESRAMLVDETDRFLTALPLFHVNAQCLSMLPALTVGGTLVLIEGFKASRFMDQVRRHEATQTSLVAMLLRTILGQPESDQDRAHKLRRVVFAINVTEEERLEFEQRFGVELINLYGMSEAMILITISPIFGPRRWPSIGLPASGCLVRIVDEDGNEVPTGQLGEITVKGVPGRTIMKEYFRDSDATARTVVDGWLHTGDNGYVDEQGYVYFYDRAKDIIKRAGENVSASEVESVLNEHPAIAMAAVIAVPDPIRDEAVKAYIVLEPGATLTDDDVVRHCATRLSKFKSPTIIDVRDELPLTSVGKIEKKILRDEIAQAPSTGAPA